MKKLEKFLKSRNGLLSLLGVLLALLLVLAYSNGLLGGLTGTAGVSYPMPPNGYTCLPTCSENDAKMFVLTGKNQQSLINLPIKVWIMVPGDQPAFTLGIFDGDSSKDKNNNINYYGTAGYWTGKNGNWDDAFFQDTTYTLYADPLADGSGQIILASWKGNDVMPNNAWWETSIDNDPQAVAPNGHYYYRLEATRPDNGQGGNAFKVRAGGYLMAGLHPEWPVGLAGMAITTSDFQILTSNASYNGDWNVYFNVITDVQKIEIWESDFDSGGDTDDLNMVGKPSWALAPAVNEGVGSVVIGKVDDMPSGVYKVSPAVYYDLLDPTGQSICVNANPSGVKEWENFVLSFDPSDNPDCLVGAPLTAGMYDIHIMGLDLHNFVWLSVNYPICDPDGGCPPMPNE